MATPNEVPLVLGNHDMSSGNATSAFQESFEHRPSTKPTTSKSRKVLHIPRGSKSVNKSYIGPPSL